jgi:hypothetical protein
MVNRSAAGDDNKALKDGVRKVAEAFKKGDSAEAKKLAEAVAKKAESAEEIMNLFQRRKSGGYGVGKEGLVTPDSIDGQLSALGRDAPTAALAKKAGEAFEEMGYLTAAICEVTLAKVPATDKGKKTKKAWIQFTTESRDAALDFAKAAKNGAQDIHKASKKVYAACSACHGIFKE